MQKQVQLHRGQYFQIENNTLNGLNDTQLVTIGSIL
jgi:hypothetical protein